MATSGSVDFDQTRNTIINDALLQVGAIAEGESPSAAASSTAARQLNRMVKLWQADGLHLWSRREAYLFLEKSKARYQLGPNSTDHSAEIADAVRTELSAAGTSGDSTIDVDSATGIAVSDNIGIVLDDDTLDWHTVISISSTTITLSGTLSGAASIDNSVFSYTNKIDRPLRIIDAQRTSTDDTDTPILTISHQEYQRLPNKTDTGKTNEVYYQPELTDGYIYLWPEPETAADRLRMTCLFPLEDFDDTSNNPDMPQEWLDALVWGLARRLIPSYGVPADIRQEIKENAAESYAIVKGWDREPESTYLAPAFDYGR